MLQETKWITTIDISQNSHVMAFSEFKSHDPRYNPEKKYAVSLDGYDFDGVYFDIFEVVN